MKMLKAILSLTTIAIFSFMKLAIAADYTVGGPNGGWDQSTDLATWASEQTFHTGDNLIFSYTATHDVIEVPEEDFGPCSTTNRLHPPHTGGLTVIPLNSTGTRYFICGTAGHCIGGMKLQITTLATSSPPPAALTPPPTATRSQPPTSSTRPPVSSPPPAESIAPGVSPSSPPPRVVAENPTLPPAAAPPPGDILLPSPSPPTPSSAAKFNVMGALLIASLGFVMIICLNL